MGRRQAHKVKTLIKPTKKSTTRPTSSTERRQSNTKGLANTPRRTAGTNRPRNRTEKPKRRRKGRGPRYGEDESTPQDDSHQERQEELTWYTLDETAGSTCNGVGEQCITTQGKAETTTKPELRSNDGHTRDISQSIDRRNRNSNQGAIRAATEKPDYNRPLHRKGPTKKRRRKNVEGKGRANSITKTSTPKANCPQTPHWPKPPIPPPKTTPYNNCHSNRRK